ncbi:aspartic-type endopeptidase OPSB 3 [Colletotrichum truncatum]|uniref:Aspartic-type endopeptidase OPSB 3 n=1 Tax=Colletotrichum truncatum TaxID=5467 RepID=A0ACC3ZL87_COLTU|nr:aspartic-type endopeptidase OPSB 3 [Colletotrichum truncatum]KAF6800059.1 aspartic-type endopeptidase OPSB 3 [Colletotrichum truncatum]
MSRLCWAFALMPLVQAAQAVPGVVHLPVEAVHDPKAMKRSVAGVKSQSLRHDQSDIQYQSYAVAISAGNPPQKMNLGLESFNSKTWLISDGVYALCDSCDNGFFTINKSVTISPLQGHESVGYGDPTTIPPSNATFELDMYTDRFDIAGVTIPKQTFGVMTPRPNGTYNGAGLLGIGPDLELGYEASKPYNTVLDSLAAQGSIASRTYSLDLRSYDSHKGALIFGGADTGRFEGELVKRPLVKDELGTFGPSIVLSHYSQVAPNGTKYEYDVPEGDSVFLLDTGNQYFRFRHSFADPLFRDLGAVNDGNDAYFVNCSKRDMPGTWDFEFGNVTIKVPYKHFITELSDDDGKTCFVGVLTTWKGQLVLGQPFLQAAYASFDFDNKEVGLAQSAHCAGKTVAFGSGPEAIPALSGCKRQ